MQFRSQTLSTLVAVMSLFFLLVPASSFGQDFVLKIPRGPSWQTFYDNKPECSHLIGGTPSTIFGFTAEQTHISSAGLTVTDVTPGGPADGLLLVGDLLVSLNGDAFISNKYGQTANRTEERWLGYSFVRGAYLFGFRGTDMVEFVLTPCGKSETSFPFDGTRDLFGHLYDTVGGSKALGDDLLIAGFARGKQAARTPSGQEENIYEIARNYCWVKEPTKVTVDRTKAKVSASGALYNEAKSQYSYSVDLALANNLRQNFDTTHNDKQILVREVEFAVSRLLSRSGCSNPEWKGFEKKMYELVGWDWHTAPNQKINWVEHGLTPPS